MNWSLQVYLAAGLGALVLGLGVLVREPGRPRNRHFALVCLALSTWTLAGAGKVLFPDAFDRFRIVSLAGACAAAPLGLHFVFVLTRQRGRVRRFSLGLAYAAAASLWIASWFSDAIGPRNWSILAVVILGPILLSALAELLHGTLAMPRGAERRAFGLLLVASGIAVIGGLSDFLPRGPESLPFVGPVAMLIFLVIVCGLIVRHRFMDVDVFLIRAVILVAGAAAGGLLIFTVVRLTGGRFLPIWLATLAVLIAASRLGRAVLSGARSVVSPQDPVARALQHVSRSLPAAVEVEDVWEAIRAGRDALPGDLRVDVFWGADPGGDYALRFRAGTGPESSTVARDAPLPRLLALEQLPLTRFYLGRELQEVRGELHERVRATLDLLEKTDTDFVIPLQRDDTLRGWVAVGGGFPERHLTAEIATSFGAVANQALASLERIDAIERAKRREALAAVGELAGGLAHEVRNPVAAIRGAAQALGPQATPEQTRQMLQVIEEESERLGLFVGEFLDYAKPTSPKREPVALEPIVRQTLKAAETAGHRVDATVDCAADLPPVLGDPDQLRRVFDNLVRNASEAGGPGVALRIALERAGDGRVSARFEDDGPGIPEEQRAQLFQPFHTTKPRGTGLGLALVHRIVESHDGKIEVSGKPGQGATFTISLPSVADGKNDAR